MDVIIGMLIKYPEAMLSIAALILFSGGGALISEIEHSERCHLNGFISGFAMALFLGFILYGLFGLSFWYTCLVGFCLGIAGKSLAGKVSTWDGLLSVILAILRVVQAISPKEKENEAAAPAVTNITITQQQNNVPKQTE